MTYKGITFEHNGKLYAPVAKVLTVQPYDINPLLYQIKNKVTLEKFELIKIRYKGLLGSASGALCIKVELIDNLLTYLIELRKIKPNIFKISNKIEKTCIYCTKSFSYKPNGHSYKFCSRKCSDKNSRATLESSCCVCSKKFHRKPYHRNKTKNLTCSVVCLAKLKKSTNQGDKNPNYKGKNFNTDGYALTIDYATNLGNGIKEQTLHKAVCCEILGISSIDGKYFHVHHRDCDKLNNTKENLVVLSKSNHRWLHAQFGSATLWAFCKDKVTLQDLLSWTDNEELAAKLLPLSVEYQTISELGYINQSGMLTKEPLNESKETL